MAVTNVTPTQELCLKIQQSLENVSGNIPTSNAPLGTLKALKSAENTAGFEQIKTTTTDGKTYSASVKFKAGKCYDTDEEDLDVCDADSTASNPNKEYSVSVDEVSSVKITLNAQDYRTLCESLDERKSFEITQAIEALKKKINLGLATKIASNLDLYFDGTASTLGSGTEKSLKLFDTTGKPNTMGLFQLKQMYNKKGYGDMSPIIVGGDPLDAWKFAQAQFAGNADKAFDVSRINGMSTFTDYVIDDIAGDGDQHLISWIAGHLQMLEAYKYVGAYEDVRQEGARTTMMDADGFMFDFAVSNPFCSDGVVTMVLSKKWDLFKVPATAFSACGAQETALGWQTSCAAVACSDLKVLS